VVIRRLLLTAVVLVTVGAWTAAAARAADAAPAPSHSWAIDLDNGLMSPFCPGRTLMDCPSPQAAKLRAWIAEQEQAGRTQDEVEEQLYQQFGDVILQAPRAEGFGLAAYVLPVVAFLAGGAVVWVFLRRQVRHGGPPAPHVPTAIDPEIERRIDEELRA
jgi:cytochrome c-type biogenesis protein CcmH/NrfF